MNILLLPTRYYPVIGGLETSVANLATQLKKRGCHVKIITTRCPFYLKPRETIDEIEVERLHFLFFSFQHYKTGRSRLINIFLCFDTLFKLACAIIKFRPDVVNIHYVSTQAIYVTLLSYIFRFRYVVSIHGLGLQELPKAPQYVHWIYHWVLKSADYITSCSQVLLDDAKKRVGGIEKKAVVIYNGIEPKRFNTQQVFRYHNPYILSIGTFYRYKAFDLLIMAFGHIADDFNADLIIAGDGVMRSDLEELTRLLRLKKRVYFFGMASREEIISLLNGCEFLAVPSRVEPFGIVILESMAACKAVVAYNVDGIPEIIQDRVNGLLVKPKSDIEFARAMAELLKNKPLRDKLAGNGRRIVEEKFGLDKQVEAFLEVYKNENSNAG